VQIAVERFVHDRAHEKQAMHAGRAGQAFALEPFEPIANREARDFAHREFADLVAFDVVSPPASFVVRVAAVPVELARVEDLLPVRRDFQHGLAAANNHPRHLCAIGLGFGFAVEGVHGFHYAVAERKSHAIAAAPR
jgi:hypothetical protein